MSSVLSRSYCLIMRHHFCVLQYSTNIFSPLNLDAALLVSKLYSSAYDNTDFLG